MLAAVQKNLHGTPEILDYFLQGTFQGFQAYFFFFFFFRGEEGNKGSQLNIMNEKKMAYIECIVMETDF